VPEFDKVVFSDEVGVVHGPVKTQFGYHLLEITDRTD
jgi:peptidyl-prolyl cis-trans isomerase C